MHKSIPKYERKKRTHAVILTASVVAVLAGILLYNKVGAKNNNDNDAVINKDAQHAYTQKDHKTNKQFTQVNVATTNCWHKTKTNDAKTLNVYDCEARLMRYIVYYVSRLETQTELCNTITQEKQRQLLLKLAAFIVDENARHVNTERSKIQYTDYKILDSIRSTRQTIIKYFLKLNILILTNKLLNERRATDIVTLSTKKECMQQAIVTIINSQIPLAVDLAILSLIHNAIRTTQGTALSAAIKNVTSTLAQLTYAPLDISKPHLRSHAQKTNILHKLSLDSYVASLFMDATLFFEKHMLIDTKQNIREHLGHIAMVGLLIDDTNVQHVIACAIEHAATIDDAQQYVDTLINAAKNISMQNVYSHFQKIQETLYNGENNAVHVRYNLANNCVSIALTLNNAHNIPTLVALLEEALELQFNDKLELTEKAHMSLQAQETVTSVHVLQILHRSRQLSQELYKTYVAHFQLEQEHLQDSKDIEEILHNAFQCTQDNDTVDTLLVQQKEPDKLSHVFTTLKILDLDYRFGYLYGLKGKSKDRLAATAHTLLTQILFNGVKQIQEYV